MYDTLLFLHVLAAFAIVASVVVGSAVALGATADKRIFALGGALWGIGGIGTLIFGIWLAIYLDGYEVWDGWVLAAIVLWAIATELGRRFGEGYRSTLTGGAEGNAAYASQAVLMHWARALVVLALLVVMIYKPGA